MKFFLYNDSLFEFNDNSVNKELEIDKCVLAMALSKQVSFYSIHLTKQINGSYTFTQSTLPLNIIKIINLHKKFRELINILEQIDKANNIDSSNNDRLLKLIDSLLVNSLKIQKNLNEFRLTKLCDKQGNNVINFFEKEIEYCILYKYKKDFESFIAYNKITTELGSLMGIYDMLFGNDLLNIDKKFTTKYIFEILKICI